MSEETNTPSTESEKLSPEEMKEMRDKMSVFYKEEIEYLTVQETYERLLADIEEHKLRGYLSMHKSSQIYASLKQEQEHPQGSETGQAPPEPV